MTNHIVSIVIPIYNVYDYVEECLESVIKQNYTDIECIIVDDCGTDNSMVKVERFVASYKGLVSFKILHHTYNRGLSAARNTGIDATTGEYIFFLDSDDYIYPHSIDTLVKAIEQEDDIDWTGGVYDNISPRSFYKKKGIYKNSMELRGERLLYPMACNCLYKTSFIREHRLYFKEGLLLEDNLWTFQVACYCCKLAICNKNTYFYRKRESSITTISFPERYRNYYIIHQEYIHYATEHHFQGRRDVFNCITHEMIYFFRIPFLSGYSNLAYDYYNVIRSNPYLSLSQIWSLTNSLKQVLIRFHRYIPRKIGYLYIWMLFQPFNSKELLYNFYRYFCRWRNQN